MSRKVAYVYSDEIETFNFGPDHPMKPKKVSLAHDIIVNYGMISHMDLYVRLLETSQSLLQSLNCFPFQLVYRISQKLF